MIHIYKISYKDRDFPGSPGVKTSPSDVGDEGSIPGQGGKIPHAFQLQRK